MFQKAYISHEMIYLKKWFIIHCNHLVQRLENIFPKCFCKRTPRYWKRVGVLKTERILIPIYTAIETTVIKKSNLTVQVGVCNKQQLL